MNNHLFLTRAQYDRLVLFFSLPAGSEARDLYLRAIHSWSLDGVSIDLLEADDLDRFKVLIKNVIGSAYAGRRIAEDQS